MREKCFTFFMGNEGRFECVSELKTLPPVPKVDPSHLRQRFGAAEGFSKISTCWYIVADGIPVSVGAGEVPAASLQKDPRTYTRTSVGAPSRSSHANVQASFVAHRSRRKLGKYSNHE